MPIFSFVGYTLTELFRKPDKKLLGHLTGTFFKNLLRFTPLRNGCLINLKKCRNSHRMCSVKKQFLKNFAIFKGKHLCWSLFITENIAKIFKNTYFEEHLQCVYPSGHSLFLQRNTKFYSCTQTAIRFSQQNTKFRIVPFVF